MIRAGLPICIGGLVASASPSAILGLISLVLGILLALGGLAYPSVSRKSMRATIDVLLIQQQVKDGRVAELEHDVERLKAQNQVLLDLQDRKVAAAIISALIADGKIVPRGGGVDGPGG